MIRLALAVGLLAAAVGSQFALAKARPAAGPAVAEGAFAALGGFRSIAAELIWFRADRLQEEGRYVELAQLANALTMSEPHTPEVWCYAAWNLAYNVSIMMPSEEDRWRWVEAAITLLRDRGLKYNPTSSEIYRELAWIFEAKLALDVDHAAPLYRARWRALVADVAARDAWAELGMDPALMAAMERELSVSDRGDPLYSAMYWASRGIARGTNAKERPFLAEVLRQSHILYRRAHPEEVPHG